MPSFNMELLKEIDFARKYFDFIEITLMQNLAQYNPRYLKQVKNRLKERKGTREGDGSLLSTVFAILCHSYCQKAELNEFPKKFAFFLTPSFSR